MSWFADLAGKAENLLNNLDEQTGAALRHHSVGRLKHTANESQSTEHPWGPKRRPVIRNSKKTIPVTDNKSVNNTAKKTNPTRPQSRSQIKASHACFQENLSPPKKKSPERKPLPVYNLNNCPKTLVDDIIDSESTMEHYGLKQRRSSLPVTLDGTEKDTVTYRMQNLEIENAMLKSEFNVMNSDISELLGRLRRTEDGNNVVSSSKELIKSHAKIENSEVQHKFLYSENETLSLQLNELKKRLNDVTNVEIIKYQDENKELQRAVNNLKEIQQELEQKISKLTEKSTESEAIQMKLEGELRHAQSLLKELQSDREKATDECRRLEKDWETYKLRVKSMLTGKDKEIKLLQDGISKNEDMKVLVEQLDALRDERDSLSESITQVRLECDDMKRHIEQLENKHGAAERIVTALRDAFKEERAAKNKAEQHCYAIAKELKSLEIETGQTIASLKTALRDKESELNHLRSTISVQSADTSALNVADYDIYENVDREKVQYLTQTLVQRQEKIDSLLADNNMLRIQLQKLESKYKAELATLKASTMHSVVHLHDDRSRPNRTNKVIAKSSFFTLPVKIAVVMTRHPLFRLFLIIYMLGLHFWVLTVLFTSTQDNYMSRPPRS